MLDSCPLHEELISPTPYQAKLHAAHIARRQRFSQAAQACQAKLDKTAHEEATRRAANAATVRKLKAALREQQRAAQGLTALEAMPVARAKAICHEIAARHLIPYADIFGPRRSKHVVAARHEAFKSIYLACPEWSILKMGQFFNKDHSSVVIALQNMRKRGELQ
jgi:chromosomal replication initiation ATPase DnaA